MSQLYADVMKCQAFSCLAIWHSDRHVTTRLLTDTWPHSFCLRLWWQVGVTPLWRAQRVIFDSDCAVYCTLLYQSSCSLFANTRLTSILRKSEPTSKMVSTARTSCHLGRWVHQHSVSDRFIGVWWRKLRAQLVSTLSEEVTRTLLPLDGQSLISGVDEISMADDSSNSPRSDIMVVARNSAVVI